MRAYRAFVVALLLDVVGAAAALLISLRPWQTITLRRSPPLHDVVVDATGRTVDSAPTALALVALAGVVALLATRGIWRRAVGAVLVVAGSVLVWRAAAAAGAMGSARARAIVAGRRNSVDVTGATPVVAAHPVWAALTAVAGALVLASGILVAVRGGRWRSMSDRYEAPDPERDRARSASAMWNVLDRGEDPTR